MSISNYNSIDNQSLTLKCYSMECKQMVFDEADVNTLDCENAIINTNLSGTAEVNLERTLSDNSEVKILMNEDLLGLGTKGVGMVKIGPDLDYRIFNCACDSSSLGGPKYLSQIGIQNTLSGDLSVIQSFYDDIGLVLGQQQVLQVGANLHSIQLTDLGGIVSQSPTGIELNSSNIKLTQFPSLSASYNSAIVSNSSATISVQRLEDSVFAISGADVNRTSALTSLAGFYNVSGDTAIVSYRFQITIGAGVGTPEFNLDVPLTSINGSFVGDDVVGVGSIYDVGATVIYSLAINSNAGFNTIRVSCIGSVAGTYNGNIEIHYQVQG